MRVLLITDSLGCPRIETPIDKTWTSRIIRKFSNSNKDVEFYTIMKHGLSISDLDLKFIHELEPNIIICQLGIVDAVRRAFPLWYTRIIKHIPILSKLHKTLASKYHYQLTKIGKNGYHTTKVTKFRSKLVDLSRAIPDGVLCLIKISSASENLERKVFNCNEDIFQYNKIIAEVVENKNIIDPYKAFCPQKYLLSDGHHLNLYGEDLVFSEVNKSLEELLEKKRIK